MQAAIEDALATDDRRSRPHPRRRPHRRRRARARAGRALRHRSARIPLHGFRRGLNAAPAARHRRRRRRRGRAGLRRALLRARQALPLQIWNAPTRAPHARPLRLAPARARSTPRAMQEAADALVGRHDFAAFRAADCERKTTVRTLTASTVARSGDLVTIEVEADAFLKNMVRILVGTLCRSGLGKRSPSGRRNALSTARDRRQAGVTAPAQGLCPGAGRLLNCYNMRPMNLRRPSSSCRTCSRSRACSAGSSPSRCAPAAVASHRRALPGGDRHLLRLLLRSRRRPRRAPDQDPDRTSACSSTRSPTSSASASRRRCSSTAGASTSFGKWGIFIAFLFCAARRAAPGALQRAGDAARLRQARQVHHRPAGAGARRRCSSRWSCSIISSAGSYVDVGQRGARACSSSCSRT